MWTFLLIIAFGIILFKLGALSVLATVLVFTQAVALERQRPATSTDVALLSAVKRQTGAISQDH